MIDPLMGIGFVVLLAVWGWLHYKLGYYAGRIAEIRRKSVPKF